MAPSPSCCELAGSDRSAQYLTDIANWISFDEGAALWRAGALVTHHPEFARAVGEDAARYLNASPVANLLRQLGSLEVVYGQIATTASKYSTATILEAVDCGPGFAEIHATPVQGFPRDANHCAWTCGILTQPAILFGLPPAVVHHEHCAAYGAARCEYRVTWVVDGHSCPDRRHRSSSPRSTAARVPAPRSPFHSPSRSSLPYSDRSVRGAAECSRREH